MVLVVMVVFTDVAVTVEGGGTEVAVIVEVGGD